ncbi:Ferric iron ABC transporter, ATP-binding protein [Candidatus Rhodobacter oscarellae]|uniref:Ferric iron ABC transporter, ATP-binding protein n=1 Tax=Candidatus Rhodobacter oscarellae TaxID=1675527 RepID=A0A0J9GUZ4_9RHOB|nr:cyclic peptide export ABC transporter [Candidatus Rhodobacter lobularis]KMW57398.1 Ferric iron ABC transporter, ATP-binding protein [Candidatus Rhodobacter lobularis]
MADENVTSTTRDLLRYILRESDLLRSPVFVFVVLASASRTALIFLINETAARGGPDIWLFAALLAASAVMLATSHWAKMTGVYVVQRLALKMRTRMAGRILAADVGFFQNRDYGQIYHGSTGHVNSVAQTTIKVAEISQAVLLLLFMLGYMLWQLPASVLATVIALLVGVGAFFATEGPATRAVKKSHEATVAYHNSVHDLLRGYKELRLRRARRHDISQRIETQVKEAQRLTVTAERHYSYGQISASGALAALLISIVTVLPLLAGADSVTILQILTLVLFSFTPIETMIGDLPQIARAGVSFRIFRDLEDGLSRNAEVQDGAKPGVDHRAGFKSIELRGATVHLTRDVGDNASAKDSFTLGPVDLTLVPGQSVFITGGNGMGKSTLLQLLTGLRHPDEGEILIDGTPVTPETISDYRSVFAAVFSEFYMFKRLYGLDAQERERLLEHIAEMGLSEGVALEEEEFSNLALSTGQMRRLALSIALAEERPVIVLDEFAADQDPARRAFFYDVLVPRLAADGHCVVAVTHDEHCFDKADRLIRMADGKIISDEMQKPAKTG